MHIEQTDTPSEADYQALFVLLDAYNDEASARPEPSRKFALLLRDDAGALAGGLWAISYYDWMFIGQLVLPAALRGTGLGSRLLRQAEAEARARGCIGVWLDSFAFQAPGFYRKQGYTEFGRIDAYPRGHARHFFLKRLDGAADAGQNAAPA